MLDNIKREVKSTKFSCKDAGLAVDAQALRDMPAHGCSSSEIIHFRSICMVDDRFSVIPAVHSV